MSKISYCSLEEAWGEAYKKNDENLIENNSKEKNSEKYDYLNKMSQIERETIIDNMNKVERNTTPENNSIVEYNKYRFNSDNKVTKNDKSENYTPFNESIEKKYLQDKLNFLENEFRKYKIIFEKNENYSNINNNNNNTQNEENIYESFSNSDDNKNENQYKNNDIIDLILLIIIGLIVIFVLNSIFSIGKTIGARSSIK